MYSVLLAVAMSTAPVTPDGLIFHRHASGCAGAQAQSAGCQGQQYAVVPVQTFVVVPQASGCTGSHAASAYAGCSGASATGYHGRHYLLPGRGARVADRANRRNGATSYVAAPQLAFASVQAVPVQVTAPAVVPEVKPAPGQTAPAPKKKKSSTSAELKKMVNSGNVTVYRTVPLSAYRAGYAVPCPSCPGGVRWIR